MMRTLFIRASEVLEKDNNLNSQPNFGRRPKALRNDFHQILSAEAHGLYRQKHTSDGAQYAPRRPVPILVPSGNSKTDQLRRSECTTSTDASPAIPAIMANEKRHKTHHTANTYAST